MCSLFQVKKITQSVKGDKQGSWNLASRGRDDVRADC